MIRSFKYRMYPTLNQAIIIKKQFDLCCWLHNTALEHRITSYKAGKSISYQEQANQLPEIKESFPQFKEVYSQILQNVLKRLGMAFQNFFKRVEQGEKRGFPRFKGKDFFHSICYPQSGFAITGRRIYLSGIGKVRLRVHRDIMKDAKVKTCTIKKYGNHWYCTLSVEIQNTPIEQKVVCSAVGIDLGLESFAVLSDGGKIENPRYLRKSHEELKKNQSKYSKHNGKTSKRKLTALHQKVTNQRNDFLHKESRMMVNKYNLIAYENLDIKNMVRGRFAKSIHDAGWGKFINMVKYKAESAGTYAIAVNPRNTSKICSGCGTIVEKKISDRQHDCNVCGLSLHRDLNASINILRLGTDRRKEDYALLSSKLHL